MKFFKIHLNFIIIAVVFVIFAGCSSSRKRNVNITEVIEPVAAEGRTEYNVRNINETREKAVYDAKLKAVRRAAEIFADVSYKADGKNSLMENLVQEDPDFFIRKYKITSEGQDRNYYFSKVIVYIYPYKIASAVKAAGLVSPVLGPKAALVIDENPEGSGFSQYFEKELSKNSVMNLQSIPKEKIVSGSYDELTAVSAEIGAEMFIRAKAKAYLFAGGLVSDFYPSGADGSVEVIQVPSGKRLSDISRQGSGNDSSKDSSMRKAMESLAEKLAKDTAERVDPQLKTDPVIKLTVSAISGIEKAEAIKSDLLKMNFKYISLDSYSEGTAVFSAVAKTQDTQEIASMILRGDTVGLQLVNAGGKEIVFTAY